MITDIHSPGWTWEHLLWLPDSTDPTALVNSGASGATAVLSGGTATLNPDPAGLDTISVGGGTAPKYTVANTPHSGPFTVVAIGNATGQTRWVMSSGSGGPEAYVHPDVGPSMKVGSDTITLDDVSPGLQLYIFVFDGASSFIRKGAIPAAGTLGAATLGSTVTAMSYYSANSNRYFTRWAMWGVVHRALTLAECQELEAWAEVYGIPMWTEPDPGVHPMQQIIDGSPTAREFDFAGQTFVSDYPVVIGARSQPLTVRNFNLIAPTDGATINPPPGVVSALWPRNRAHIVLNGASDVTLADFTIQGPNPLPTFDAALEEQDGVYIDGGSTGIRIIGFDIRNVHGDAVTGQAQSSHIVVAHGSASTMGRQGMSFNYNEHVTLHDVTIDGCGRSGLDFEPYAATWHVGEVDVSRVDIRNVTNLMIAAAGSGTHGRYSFRDCTFAHHWMILREDTVFEGNTITGLEQPTTTDKTLSASGGVFRDNVILTSDGQPVLAIAAGTVWERNATNAEPAT